MSRFAYLLTANPESKRTTFSKILLEKIGFNVILQPCVFMENAVISNKFSFLTIFQKIAQDATSKWSYVFEDDVNILSKIQLKEIIEYENLAATFFYLGLCEYSSYFVSKSDFTVNDKHVYFINGGARGMHATGWSREGAELILDFIQNENYNELYMDVIVERFNHINIAPVVRYDLESYISGHKGIFFQDRKMFPSEIL